jgi:alpha-glucosidase
MAIAPVWDETRILPGSEPGKIVAEARRSGQQWFVAVINGGEATTLDISLNFLGPGSWKSIQLRDTEDKPDAWDRQEDKATPKDHIRLHLAARAGFVGWLQR